MQVKTTMPTDSQWRLIRWIAALLEPFMCVQMMLEGEKYVTNSLVVPLISDMRGGLQRTVQALRDAIDTAPGDTGVEDAMLVAAQATLTAFIEKWGDGITVCTFETGVRRQPKGFTPNQVCVKAKPQGTLLCSRRFTGTTLKVIARMTAVLVRGTSFAALHLGRVTVLFRCWCIQCCVL